MAFFRRSGPTLEQCIENNDYQCVVRFYLKGKGEDAAAAIGALLIFSKNDPRSVADILGSLNERDRTGVARAIVQSGGPDSPAVLALAGSAGTELGRALGRAVMRCGEDAFDALVESTGDDDQKTRLGAISMLGFIGKPGIPILKQHLYRGEGEEQRTAARCLHNLKWTPENPDEKPMFFFLCDEWKELIKLKERALPLLFSLVKSDNAALRRDAIKGLGEIGDSRAVPVILPLVDDGDSEVRIAAVSALMHFDTPETEQRLVSAMGHMDSQIRIDAAHALKRRGWAPKTQGDQIRYTIAGGNWDAVIRFGDQVIPDLIRIVRSGDNEWSGAVYALAGLGPDAAQELQVILPSLTESRQKDVVGVFKKSAEKHRLKRENLQKKQQEALEKQELETKGGSGEGEAKGPSDAEILETQKRVLEGFKWLRLQKIATEQIYAIISEGVEVHNISFEMAVAALSSKDEAIRAAAIDVLSMKGERAYPYIMKAAYDKSQIVRSAVADAVGFIAQPSLLKVLALLSKDSSVEVRFAVVRALQVMSDDRAFPYIIHFFSDEDAMIRDAASHAAATYGQFGIPILIRSLRMEDSEIRIAAAAALGEICDVRSLAYLIPHLSEPDRRVRDAIRAAIVQHDYRAIEPLQEFIKEAEGEAKNAALLALYEINPDLAGEIGADSHIYEEALASAESAGMITDSRAGLFSSTKRPGSFGKEEVEPAAHTSSPGGLSDDISDVSDIRLDSRTCQELVLRIEGGEESLSSALLVDLYDEKSSLKADLISAMRGDDREFAMHASTLLSKIGWSPAGAVEETIYLLSAGKIDELKKGGESTARVLSQMVNSMPASVQNTIVDVLSGIGGREGVIGLSQIISGGYGTVSDAARESLIDMDPDVIPYIREAALSYEGTAKQRLDKIIRIMEQR